MSLLQQADELASLVSEAANECIKKVEGKAFSYVDKQNSGVLKVEAMSLSGEERLSKVLSALLHAVAEEICTPNGEDDFGTIDHSKALQLLEDPLSAAARSARRNALAASAFVFLIGITGAYPKKLPGFDLDLGDGKIVGALAVLVLLYQALTFFLYARSDREKRLLAEKQVGSMASSLHRSLSKIEKSTKNIEGEFQQKFNEYLSDWLAHANEERRRLDKARSAAGHRQNWDIWLPVLPIAIAFLVFMARLIFLSQPLGE